MIKDFKLENQILIDLKNCIGKEIRKETETHSALFSINIKNLNLLRQKYDLEFNSLFFGCFCFLSKNFKNKPEEYTYFKSSKILFMLSEQLSTINKFNLNNFLNTYTNTNLQVIEKNISLKGKEGYFLNRDLKHPIKLLKFIRSENPDIPPYNSYNYLIKFFDDTKSRLCNKTIIIGNNSFLRGSLYFN